MASEARVRKSSRVKRQPDRWTILRKIKVRIPRPEEVEESDGEDVAALVPGTLLERTEPNRTTAWRSTY